MKHLRHIIKICILLVFVTSCKSKGKPENFDYGTVKDYVYTNEFFNMSMQLPQDWVIQTQEQTEKLADMGKEMISADDKNMKAVIKASEVNVANLLSVFQYEVGTNVDFNANIVLVAENISFAPGIKTGADYLVQTKKIIESSSVGYDYLSDAEKITINGTDFYKMDARMYLYGTEINQAFYSTVIDGFCFNAVVSWGTDEQKAILDKSLQSMKFASVE